MGFYKQESRRDEFQPLEAALRGVWVKGRQEILAAGLICFHTKVFVLALIEDP